ncbi:MAG: GAF domain-containing sensor histidine kinase [Chloroflexi bacterium]|nr:GAF domain-containing sensor histidine kinase [Chloroflexota bacterium]
MSNSRLKWIGILGPVIFWLLVLVSRTELFDETRTLAGDIFALVVIGTGAAVFSTLIFRVVEQREAEIRRRTEQLRALHEAGLFLTTELDLAAVLQRVVDLSRQLVNARYAALGVLSEDGETIDQFITSGVTAEQRGRMGQPPTGHGLLGVIIREAKPLRLPDLSRDARASGFPPHHPRMHSLLGVPIMSKGRVIGDLYLTDKMAGAHDDGHSYTVFDDHDQQIVEMFATQAAIAVENAQLYRQTQQLAIMKERERFGMDLHDGIIQSIYAIGLMLEDAQLRAGNEPAEAGESIKRAIHGLNDVIRDIRNYILELRPQRFQGRDLRRGLEELARDMRANSFLNVSVAFDNTDLSVLSAEQTVEILHIAQEALSNVRKHARATAVEIGVHGDDGHLLMTVDDNGQGINPVRLDEERGYGLGNMRERASNLGGEARVELRERGGTRLSLRVPLTMEETPK